MDKHDCFWEIIFPVKDWNNPEWKCIYCDKIKKGSVPILNLDDCKSFEVRLATCVDKVCPSCRDGFCHDTCMVRLANFCSRVNEGICGNWKPKKVLFIVVDTSYPIIC